MKSFHAADMRSALRDVRESLGPDAVILDSRVVEGGVEVSAAVDYEETEDSRRAAGMPRPGAPGAPGAAPAVEDVGAEIRSLRGLLEERIWDLARGDSDAGHPVRAAVIRRFESLGLARSLAGSIAQRVPENAAPARAWDQALEVLEQRLPLSPEDLLDSGGVVALLGATGVGKTTTVAKLAARFALRHGPAQVAMITTDNYRIGAHEQLRSYARIMGVPLSVARDADELAAAIGSHYGRRLVLIDTAGMSQRDRRFCEQARLLAEGSELVRCLLALPASSQRESLEEAVRAFPGRGPDGCVITKVDETASLGPVLSVVAAHALPVAYVTAGQRVPEDLSRPRPHALLEQALALDRAPTRRAAGASPGASRPDPWAAVHAGG